MQHRGKGVGGLGDVAEEFGGGVAGGVFGDVGLGEDAAAAAVVVDDGDAADLALFHSPDALVEVHVRRYAEEIGGHAVGRAKREGVLAFGDGADDDVAVGDDADGAVGFGGVHDGKRAAI